MLSVRNSRLGGEGKDLNWTGGSKAGLWRDLRRRKGFLPRGGQGLTKKETTSKSEIAVFGSAHTGCGFNRPEKKREVWGVT